MSPTDALQRTDETPWLLKKTDAGMAAADESSLLNHCEPGFTAFGLCLIRRIGALLQRIDRYWAGVNQRRIEEYLSQSADLAECERRVRDLDRDGWTMS